MTEEEKNIWDLMFQTGDMLTKPAAAVEKFAEYADAPRGAIAGGVKAAMDNTDIIEGIKQGWSKNTSWGEVVIPEETRKEHPTLSAIGGLGMDILADPMWLFAPAKISKGIESASKAIGLTDHVINPAVKAVKDSTIGAEAIAKLQDWGGMNRVNDAGINTNFNQGRAADALYADDLVDPIREYKKMGGNAEDITRYIEAAESSAKPVLSAEKANAILDSHINGTLADDIANGLYSKEEALDAFRGAAGRMDEASRAQREAASLVREQQGQVNQLEKLAETEQAKREQDINRMMGERDSIGKAINEVDEAKGNATFSKEEALQAGKNTIADNRQALRDEVQDVNGTLKNWQEDVGKIRESATTRKLKRKNIKSRLKEIKRELKANSKIKIGKNPTAMEAAILQKRAALLKEQESLMKNLDDLKAADDKAGQDINTMGILSDVARARREDAVEETGKRIADLQSNNRAMESGIESAWDVARGAQSLMRERRADVHSDIQRARKESEIRQAFEKDDVVKAAKELTDLQDKLVKAKQDVKRARQGTKIPDYLLQQHQVDALAESSKRLKSLAEAYKEAKAKGMDDTAAMIREGMKQEKVRAYANLPDYITREKVLSDIKDENLRKAVQAAADPIIEKMKKDADALSKAGLLGNEALVHFQGGSHLRRSYTKWETPEDFLEAVKKNGTPEEYQRAYADYQKSKGASSMGKPVDHRISQKDFMQRQRLSTETMKKMGLIEDAEYRVLDTLNRSSKSLREKDYLAEVAEKFGKEEKEAAELSRNLPKAREYVPVPESESYGALAGKWIPRDVAEKVMRKLGGGSEPNAITKAIAHWKVGKLASPDAIARNFYSGLPMANVFGNVPMMAMPKLMKDVSIAMKQGKKSNFWREYRSSGAQQVKMARAELEGVLDGNRGVKAHLKEGDIGGAIKGVEAKAMEAFGAPDDFWRCVVFKHYRDKGMDIKAAGEKARQALLDYENTPEWVMKLARTGIVPFGRFAFHAAKQTAKAAWNNPAKVSAWGKYQNQSDDNVKELYPEYLKPHNLIPLGESTRIVNGKEQKILDNIDMQYISPFANDVSIGGPALDALHFARTGQNTLGQQIVRPGMSGGDKTKAIAEQAANMLAPKVFTPQYIEKFVNAALGKVDSKGRQYDMSQVLQQNLAGIKHVPVNAKEMYMRKMTDYDIKIQAKEKEIKRIEQDESLSKEERKRKIRQYVGEIKNIVKDTKKTTKAYKEYKKNR